MRERDRNAVRRKVVSGHGRSALPAVCCTQSRKERTHACPIPCHTQSAFHSLRCNSMTKVPTPDREMMNTREAVLEAPSTFAACLNAHGLYNTLQFVLRLSPRI